MIALADGGFGTGNQFGQKKGTRPLRQPHGAGQIFDALDAVAEHRAYGEHEELKIPKELGVVLQSSNEVLQTRNRVNNDVRRPQPHGFAKMPEFGRRRTGEVEKAGQAAEGRVGNHGDRRRGQPLERQPRRFVANRNVAAEIEDRRQERVGPTGMGLASVPGAFHMRGTSC